MRVGVSVGSAYYDGSNWEDLVELVRVADRIGVESCWTAEAWGMESTTPLAYLGALTSNIRLGTGTTNLSHLHPVLVACHAAMFDHLSEGRFILGVSPGALPSDAEALGIFDEDAMFGAFPDSHHEGGWCGKSESTGTGDNQHIDKGG